MRVVQLGLCNHQVIVRIHSVVLEDDFVTKLLLDDVDNENTAIIGHHDQVFFGVERDKAPLIPLGDAFDDFICGR